MCISVPFTPTLYGKMEFSTRLFGQFLNLTKLSFLVMDLNCIMSLLLYISGYLLIGPREPREELSTVFIFSQIKPSPDMCSDWDFNNSY